jgi:hypothetical protein
MWRASWSWQPERTLLNQVIDQAQVEVSGLDLRMQNLTHEVVLLRTMVDVLVGVLRETKAVDAELLETRMHAALDDLDRKAPLPTGDLNQSLTSRPTAAGATLLRCIRCKGEFAPERTMMTADGAMCDSCSAKP